MIEAVHFPLQKPLFKISLCRPRLSFPMPSPQLGFLRGGDGGSHHLQKPAKPPVAKNKKDPLNLPKKKPAIRLSRQQQQAVDLVLQKKSVFITGVAGTGKSGLLDHLIKKLPAAQTFVTASTGIAAVNIRGTTLHSFAGIGLGDLQAHQLARKVQGSAKALKRWNECEYLIVDEISMISGNLFTKLDSVARAVKKVSQPFGGITLILVGDFLQLPPVIRGGPGTKADFAFCSKAWRECALTVIQLTHVFRQEDAPFIHALAEIREGECTRETRSLLAACEQQTHQAQQRGIMPTELFATRKEVAGINTQKLKKLKGPHVTYHCLDAGDKGPLASLQKNCQAVQMLELKVGAQVMLVKNLDPDLGLVNGSRGVVTRLVVEEASTTAARHAVCNESTWPVVLFANGLELPMYPETWEIQARRKTVASRTQVPLILAWSLTIHKCQGMSLDSATLSLSSCFAPGQAYVALSRIRDPRSLQLRGFSEKCIKAHPTALRFYRELEEKGEKGAGGSTTQPVGAKGAGTRGGSAKNNKRARHGGIEAVGHGKHGVSGGEHKRVKKIAPGKNETTGFRPPASLQ